MDLPIHMVMDNASFLRSRPIFERISQEKLITISVKDKILQGMELDKANPLNLLYQ